MTHDVIMRGMRFRVGDDAIGDAPETRDGIGINGPDRAGNPVRNVIIDHCSISWAIDENIGVARAEDVTIQWSLISESLNESIHPKGSHGNALLLAEGGRRVSVHHNLLAHNSYRNPLIKGDTEVEFVNNLVYNWGHGAIVFEDGTQSGPTKSVIMRNFFKPGPNSTTDTAVRIYKNTDTRSEIFVAENAGTDTVRADLPLLAASAPLLEPPVPVSSEPAARLEALVLAGAGARSPARDSIDARVVREVRLGAGGFVNSPVEVGGWAALEAWEGGAAPADADGDGMPDSFEAARGLNPHDPADGNERAPSGYTWVEEYINGLIPAASGRVVHLPLLSR
jgi:hypothetical protein